MSKRSMIQRGSAWRVLRLARPAPGFTLIELMVAMVLGLVVIAGVVSVFLANQRSYRTNQALGDVQDGSRIAFEMMARDIRNAGLTGCDNSGRVANVLKASPTGGGTAAWWADWNNTLVGYDKDSTVADPALTGYSGTAEKDQVADSDSLMLLGGEGTGLSVKSDVEPTGTFTLNETTANLANGDVVIVCSPDHAALVQINSYSSSGGITFNHAASGSPGNCSIDLSYPSLCSSTSSYVFVANSQVTKLTAVDWYLAHNPVTGGTSLYRISLVNNAGVPTPTTSEMVRDVTAMTITYHQSGGTSFVAANAVSNWALVDAVQVALTLESTDKRAGTNVKALTRSFTATTTVRNRVI
jgi:type IV pilus assembly protein PilW